MYSKWTEVVLAALILVFAIWPTQILAANMSLWIVIISAAILLVHSLVGHNMDGSHKWMKSKKRKR